MAQLRVQDATRVQAIMEAQKNAIQERIAHMPHLSASVAKELIEVISSGPWAASHKSGLADAINGRLLELMSPSESHLTTGKRRVNQSMTSFHNYLSQSDVDVLTSGTNDVHKLQVVVDRCMKLGLDIPSERTTQHIMSVFMGLAKPGMHD